MSIISLAVYRQIVSDSVTLYVSTSDAIRIANKAGHRIGVYATGVRCADADADPDYATDMANEDISLVYIILDL